MAVARWLAAGHHGRLLPQRTKRVENFLTENGAVAVMESRIVPVLPYGLVNYSAGLTRLTYRDMALGTVIGAAPKVFGYTALGGNLDDLTSPEAITAVVLLVLLALAGAAVRVAANKREPVAACSTRNAPRTITASPTLNTFAPGQPAGMAKTSPRNQTWAFDDHVRVGERARLHVKARPSQGHPATPASRRRSPRWRRSSRARPARPPRRSAAPDSEARTRPPAPYVKRCTTRCTVVSPDGTTVTISTWTPNATTTSQTERSSTSERAPSLPPAAGTDRRSRRKARARVIRGRWGGYPFLGTPGRLPSRRQAGLDERSSNERPALGQSLNRREGLADVGVKT